MRRIADEPVERRFERYHRLTDAQWRRIVMDSVDGPTSLPMPGFPTSAMQADFVGNANHTSMAQAWNVYMILMDRLKVHGIHLGRDAKILDFGCGWGRFARLFLREVPEPGIWCADTYDLAIDVCRQTGVPGHFVQIPQMPPSPLPTAGFDLCFSFSVFSHLSPSVHSAWAEEVGRVVKPGGMAFITTQGPWLLDRCRRLRARPEEIRSEWQEKLATSFIDHDAELDRYNDGEFLFAATAGAGQSESFYGEAIVPEQQFAALWGRDFEVMEFICDRTRSPQAIAVMKRRDGAST